MKSASRETSRASSGAATLAVRPLLLLALAVLLISAPPVLAASRAKDMTHADILGLHAGVTAAEAETILWRCPGVADRRELGRQSPDDLSQILGTCGGCGNQVCVAACAALTPRVRTAVQRWSACRGGPALGPAIPRLGSANSSDAEEVVLGYHELRGR